MIRKRVSFAVAGAIVASSALSVGLAAPASAADTQFDPGFVPAAGDLVGVGSDTIEIALDHLAKGANGTAGFNASGAGYKVASFAAAGTPTDVVLRSGSASIPRSTINGSGAGKNKLYGAGNNTDVSFARSSSSLNPTEVSAGLQQFPFAVDGLKLGVSATATNAPATITPSQLVAIYSGAVTNWSEIGGQPGLIKPYVPQAGSGTLSFFTAQLTAANNGNPVSLAGTVGSTQEHDDTDIKSNPNAIAPFSTARAKNMTSTIKLEKGFKAYRAVYNVVRGGDLANPTLGAKLDAVFGEDGFICGPTGKTLIEAAGFDQLATPTDGGVCGVPTDSAVTSFVTSGQVDTETTLAVDSSNDNVVKLTATVDASSDPAGTVTFKEGSTTIGTVEVEAGKATKKLSLVPTGSYSYTASFEPTDPLAFTASASSAVASTVKTASQVSVGVVNPTSTYGSTRLVAVAATVDGEAAAGAVSVKVDNGTAVSVSLVNGVGFYTVPGTTAVGSHTVSATFAGSGSVSSDVATSPLVVTKATTKTSFTLSPSKVKVKKTTKAKVTVAINGASTVKPSGAIVIKSGSKVVGSGTVTNGVATITIAKQTKKGTYSLKATFTGNTSYAGSSSSTVKLTVTK